MRFADTAKTIITLRNKSLKIFGLETNFESARPIPHHVETKTISLSSRPRSQKIGLETGLETYITGRQHTKNAVERSSLEGGASLGEIALGQRLQYRHLIRMLQAYFQSWAAPRYESTAVQFRGSVPFLVLSLLFRPFYSIFR